MARERGVKKRKRVKILSNVQIIVIATISFAAIMIFFDSNNIYVKAELEGKISQLIRVRDSLVNQISADSTIVEGIEHDDEFLERYARENFYMRRGGEEVFIVKPGDE